MIKTSFQIFQDNLEILVILFILYSQTLTQRLLYLFVV